MQLLNLLKNEENIDDKVLNKWFSYIENIDESKVIVYNPTIDILTRFSFNFYGLLTELNIPYYLHYPHLLINNLKSSNDFRADITDIKIINSEYLLDIYNVIKDEIEKEN